MDEFNSKENIQFSDSYTGDFSSYVELSAKDKKEPVTIASITPNFLKVLLEWQKKYVNRNVKITIETVKNEDGEIKTESSEIKESEVIIKKTE